jgi:hypothetical protein
VKIPFPGQMFKDTVGVYVGNVQDEFRDRDFIDILRFKSTNRKLVIIEKKIT